MIHFSPKHILWVCAVFSIGITLFSCKKKSDNPAPASPIETDTNTVYTGPTGTVSFHLHTYIDETEVDGYTYVYTTTEGRKISLDMAQLYFYKITLIKEDGSTFAIKDTIKLKTLEFDTYLIGNAPLGKYKSIKFNVGLSSATNSLSPTTNKLLNHSEMWFDANTQPNGYVFVNIAGKIDTTTDMTAENNQMQPFKYLIGTNANLTTVTMPVENYNIVQDQNTYIHMYIDYSQIFNGIQLNDSRNLNMATAAENSSPLGMQLKNNIARMFRYEN
jgi:hypothetical protein